MAVGLEARVPLLDRRVLSFTWRLPSRLLIEQGRGKQPLRRILGQFLPRDLSERPKMGFRIPLGNWLRGPLRDWAEQLLSPDNLDGMQLLNPDEVRRRLNEHVQGRVNRQHELWTILMLQGWARHWRVGL